MMLGLVYVCGFHVGRRDLDEPGTLDGDVADEVEAMVRERVLEMPYDGGDKLHGIAGIVFRRTTHACCLEDNPPVLGEEKKDKIKLAEKRILEKTGKYVKAQRYVVAAEV